ncbi:MAG TPA: PAS domain S-box protein [Syntrophales bacterium]|nr:PAS domain S-box protein [Syntrophales bacterium]
MGCHFFRFSLSVFLCLALTGVFGCDSFKTDQPQAKRGILDLTGWDFERKGAVNLAGEYEFYWSRHMTPADFAAVPRPRPSGFIRVPGYWKDYQLDGQELPGFGYATYRLTILVGDERAPLAIQIPEVSTAYRLYVDRNEMVSVGVAGESMETTIPRQYPVQLTFTPASNRVTLLIQVSNFQHRRGGLWPLMTLGKEKILVGQAERKRALDFFLLGGIFVMAIYHLSLFLARRKFKPTLYFGVFCCLIALRLLTTGQRSILQIMPGLDWELMVKLEYLSFYLAVPVFGLFLQSLFGLFSRRFIQAVLLMGLVFSLIVIVAPVRVFSHSLLFYEAITAVLILYAFYRMLSNPIREYMEPSIFLISMSLLCLAVINDMLYVGGLINTGLLVPLGLFLFIFSQAFILYVRIIKTMSLVETQGMELQNAFEAYKEEIRGRLRIEESMRESEEKYRTILNSIQEGYYEVDLNGNMTFFNDSLCRILGYTRDELTGMNNRQYMSVDASKHVYNFFLNVFRTGEPATAFDWEVIAKDGTHKTVEASVALIRNASGTPTGFRGVVRDITDRKHAEKQAKQQQQQLMQASKMAALGVLSSGIAHEINNPNNFIMLNAPILREAWDKALPILEEYYRENGDFIMGGMNYSEMRVNAPVLFSGILDGATRIKQIVGDLKDYVRRDEPDLTQSLDVNAVLRSSLSLVSHLIVKSTEHFSIDYGQGIPPVDGNFQKLEQVVINIIQNACHSLPDRNRGIFVSTSYSEEMRAVIIRVEDQGIGIPAERIQHITDTFFTTKQHSGGIGLGLSISKKIVEEHGGKLVFTSELDKGTIVDIVIPINRNAGTFMENTT